MLNPDVVNEMMVELDKTPVVGGRSTSSSRSSLARASTGQLLSGCSMAGQMRRQLSGTTSKSTRRGAKPDSRAATWLPIR